MISTSTEDKCNKCARGLWHENSRYKHDQKYDIHKINGLHSN